MSDNELDAELLGMVGGESDDEGDSDNQSINQTQAVHDDEEPKPTVEKAEEPQKSTKGVAQKVRGRKKKTKRRESIDEEILDLGDGSSSPSHSVDAAVESDYDAPGSPASLDDEAPLYPLEGVYRDVDDRERLLDMPEIEREGILAERREEETRRQQDLQLRRATASSRAAEASKNKRKASAADLEDGGRRSRPKAEKTKTALDDYKRARELKGTDRGRVDSGRGRKGDRSRSSRGSDRDAEGDSEVEWAEPSSDTRLGRDEPPAELRDFERCRVGRSNFSKVCFYPGFEDSIRGCFARVSIGPNRETGQNQYRMTQIKGFTEGKAYQMEGSNGKIFTTDQYAVVAHGASERSWPFSACSDGRLSDEEFDRYMDTLKKDDIRAPSKKYLAARIDAIHNLLNISWDDATLSKKFANQRAMQQKHDPANIARLKREAIEKRKQEAVKSGDTEEAERCDSELTALNNNTSAAVNGNGSNAPAVKRLAPGVAQQERMAALNAKNRGKNQEEVRKALLEERRRMHAAKAKALADVQQKQREEAAKAKMLAVPKNDMDDLFGSGSDASRAATPVGGAGTPKRSRAATPLNGIKREKSTGPIGAIKSKKMDDEVIGAMDLGIDIEI